MLLHLLAGGCYLANKLFLAVAERLRHTSAPIARRWRIAAWAIYLGASRPG